jgi:hypothetical protein
MEARTVDMYSSDMAQAFRATAHENADMNTCTRRGYDSSGEYTCNHFTRLSGSVRKCSMSAGGRRNMVMELEFQEDTI